MLLQLLRMPQLSPTAAAAIFASASVLHKLFTSSCVSATDVQNLWELANPNDPPLAVTQVLSPDPCCCPSLEDYGEM